MGLESSTVTPQEKKAFQRLFDMRKGDDGGAEKGREEKDGLDGILDAAMDRIKPSERPIPQFPDALRPMAEKARERGRTEKAKRLDARERGRQEIIQAQLEEVLRLMDEATTDVELWRILNFHILNRVAALGLDMEATPRQQAAAKVWRQHQLELFNAAQEARTAVKEANEAGQTPAEQHLLVSDLDVLTANLPTLFNHFVQVLNSSFPSSTLSLNLLPALKQLGPSAFALAATTSLYNAHMSALYSHYGPTALHPIAETLREMDREVYEFDDETLALLLQILKDGKRTRRGNLGAGVEALWKTDSVSRGVKGILSWREIVVEKRQEAALRRAREEEAMREAETEEGGAEVEGPEVEGERVVNAATG